MSEIKNGKNEKSAELGKTCPAGKISVGPFTRKDGSKVAPFCTTDKGKPGKGPKLLPKPKKGGLKGWAKDASEPVRHAALLRVVRAEGCATAIRKMVLIENLTTDAPTKAKLRQDREWLHGQKTCKLKSKMASADPQPAEKPQKAKAEKLMPTVNVVPEVATQ